MIPASNEVIRFKKTWLSIFRNPVDFLSWTYSIRTSCSQMQLGGFFSSTLVWSQKQDHKVWSCMQNHWGQWQEILWHKFGNPIKDIYQIWYVTTGLKNCCSIQNSIGFMSYYLIAFSNINRFYFQLFQVMQHLADLNNFFV